MGKMLTMIWLCATCTCSAIEAYQCGTSKKTDWTTKKNIDRDDTKDMNTKGLDEAIFLDKNESGGIIFMLDPV